MGIPCNKCDRQIYLQRNFDDEDCYWCYYCAKQLCLAPNKWTEKELKYEKKMKNKEEKEYNKYVEKIGPTNLFINSVRRLIKEYDEAMGNRDDE